MDPLIASVAPNACCASRMLSSRSVRISLAGTTRSSRWYRSSCVNVLVSVSARPSAKTWSAASFVTFANGITTM
jgi:hypothetical protein